MLKRLLTIGLGLLSFGVAPALAQPARPALEMWRLDCGEIHVTDLNVFSDTYAYVGRQMTLTDSCYLIRNGDRYLLWDTGLPGELAGSSATEGPFRMTVRERVRDQLARIGVQPGQVTFVGVSHYHDDHIGQAADFRARPCSSAPPTGKRSGAGRRPQHASGRGPRGSRAARRCVATMTCSATAASPFSTCPAIRRGIAACWSACRAPGR